MHSSATTFVFCASIFLFGFCESIGFDADEDVIFKLYKRDNPTNYTVLTINQERSISNETLFDPGLPTKIHIHGYLAKEEIIDRYRQAYLSVGDYNFIVVDWLEGAFTLNYFMAKRRVKDVSRKNKNQKMNLKFLCENHFQSKGWREISRVNRSTCQLWDEFERSDSR